MTKGRFFTTANLTKVMFVVGVFVAHQFHNYFVKEVVVIGSAILAVGLLCLLLASLQTKTLSSPSFASYVAKKKQCIQLLLWQSAFFGSSVACFDFLERQTQVNPRHYSLETGSFIHMLQENLLGLGLLPWAICAVLGVGIAYLATHLGRKPMLSRILILHSKWRKKLFLHNSIMTIVNLCVIFPVVVFSGLLLVWLGETINLFLGWGSFFTAPEQTLFVCALIVILLRSSNQKLVDFMQKYHLSVGSILLIYLFFFLFLLLWLHVSADFLRLGGQILESAVAIKSLSVNSVVRKTLDNRIFVFIFGWWAMWMPWMSSVIARASLGHSVLGAFVQALLFPVLMFCVVLPKVSVEHWDELHHWFQQPCVQALCVLASLGFLWAIWSKTYTWGDLYKGAMISVRPMSKRPLKDWTLMLLMSFSCYVLSSFMMGWVVTQFFVNGGLLMMLMVGVFFVVAWGIELWRSLAATKYKARTLS